MFMAEVVNVKADQQYIDPRTGAFDLAQAEPLVFAHGQYFTLGRKLGKFGFSVEKKRRKAENKAVPPRMRNGAAVFTRRCILEIKRVR